MRSDFQNMAIEFVYYFLITQWRHGVFKKNKSIILQKLDQQKCHVTCVLKKNKGIVLLCLTKTQTYPVTNKSIALRL